MPEYDDYRHPALDHHRLRMPLFRLGGYTLENGDRSKWRVECAALAPLDWNALSVMAQEIVPPYKRAVAASAHGRLFAEALDKLSTPASNLILVVDDEWIAGHRMKAAMDTLDIRAHEEMLGLVVFCRETPPPPANVCRAIWYFGRVGEATPCDNVLTYDKELAAEAWRILCSV